MPRQHIGANEVEEEEEEEALLRQLEMEKVCFKQYIRTHAFGRRVRGGKMCSSKYRVIISVSDAENNKSRLRFAANHCGLGGSPLCSCGMADCPRPLMIHHQQATSQPNLHRPQVCAGDCLLLLCLCGQALHQLPHLHQGGEFLNNIQSARVL